MEIETKRASLDTMAVTIQALHVDGKQMTLAVFRQLPETWGRDDVGEPWGYVRHTTASRADIWVVHSKEGRLERYKTVGPFDRMATIKELKDAGYRRSELSDAFDEAMDEHRLEYAADRDLINALPQLFIAV